MGDKTYENWVEKYKWIPDYDRDAVWDWYDTYMEKCYGTPTKDIEDLIDLLNEAYKVISYLLDEANRSNSKRFTQGKGSYQEIQRALHDISCHFLIGKNRNNCRIIIPREAVDSIEETEMNY